LFHKLNKILKESLASNTIKKQNKTKPKLSQSHNALEEGKATNIK